MLLTLKDDNATGNQYLCNIFYVLIVIMISDYICTKVYLYTIAICIECMIMNMCPYLLLVAMCVVHHLIGMFNY